MKRIGNALFMFGLACFFAALVQFGFGLLFTILGDYPNAESAFMWGCLIATSLGFVGIGGGLLAWMFIP